MTGRARADGPASRRAHVPPRTSRVWPRLVLAALATAVVVDVSLSALHIRHDAPLVALIVATAVAAGALALEAVDATSRPRWSEPRPDIVPGSGEDTRTATYRHLVQGHETSREGDDTVLWRIADLAARRLRQVHGIRYADDPVRATELLGPALAGLVALDRRQRYQPGRRHPRLTVAQLGDLLHRIEQL